MKNTKIEKPKTALQIKREANKKIKDETDKTFAAHIMKKIVTSCHS